ncbi:MAG: penicillin-binding protein 2, partial [Alphaproteobacteria bacterium]
MTVAGLNAPKPFAWRWISAAVWWVEHEFERSRSGGKPVDSVRMRMVFILAAFIAGFGALGIGAIRAAVSPAPVSAWTASLPSGSRADLVDRRGELLAMDLTSWNLYLDPHLIWDKAETRRVLAPMLSTAALARMDQALASGKRQKVFGPFPQAVRDQLDGMGLPGVSFEAEAGRSYPLGSEASHLVGYVRNDGLGMAGAEGALDEQIRAQAGKGPVALALDLKVQAALEDELKNTIALHTAKAAVGVITNIRTGEVLALSSLPDTTPDRLASDPTNYVNRAANRVYEMGSTFKIFTLAAGLDSGRVTLDSKYDVGNLLVLPGQTIHDSHSESGYFNLHDVFIHSSNIGAARMALEVGSDTMVPYYTKFGLLEKAPIELKESARPLVPGPKVWTTNALANRAFGHGIAVSPLAMAAGVGAIMNGGEYVPLTILKRDAPPQNLRRVISPETSQKMLGLMRDNVLAGTGRSAETAAPGFSVGGKTGTAEKPVNGSYARSTLVSSFAAIFPTDAPVGADKYLVLIMVDEPNVSAKAPGRPTGG